MYETVENALQANSDANANITNSRLLKEMKEEMEGLRADMNRMKQRIKGIESDQRTDTSIARAVRGMDLFGKIPQGMKGSSFLEEIKDYY